MILRFVLKRFDRFGIGSIIILLLLSSSLVSRGIGAQDEATTFVCKAKSLQQ
jgi:hypothetical protein